MVRDETLAPFSLSDAEDGSFFIDRSPKHFGIILEYFRSGRLLISNLNDEQLDSLRSELDYYQVGLLISFEDMVHPPSKQKLLG